MKHFHIKQMLWPYVPFIFSTHLVAFKKPPGFNALFFGVIEDGQFGCSAAVWFDWWQWCAGRGAHGSEESHKQWAVDLLLMVQKSVVHQLAGSLSHYLQRSIHPRWLLGISEPSTVGHLLYTRDFPFTQGLFHKTWKKGPFTNQSQIWWNATSYNPSWFGCIGGTKTSQFLWGLFQIAIVRIPINQSGDSRVHGVSDKGLAHVRWFWRCFVALYGPFFFFGGGQKRFFQGRFSSSSLRCLVYQVCLKIWIHAGPKKWWVYNIYIYNIYI